MQYKISSELNYSRWRENRLRQFEQQDDSLRVLEVKDPLNISPTELDLLKAQVESNNFVIYRLADEKCSDKEAIRQMVRQIGMVSLDNNLCADKDSLSSITFNEDYSGAGYIPYTNKSLSWHTDGYYNPIEQHIRSFLLHCVRPADSGGENYLLNHERIFIQLCDEDESLAAALMHPQAMGIPANQQSDAKRPAQYGPVFYFDASGHLQMRYTSRTRSIIWRDDPVLVRAVEKLREIISNDHPQAVCYRLSAGEGIITNNVLHARSAFTDGNIPSQRRLLYRARSYQHLFGSNFQSDQIQGADHVVAK